MNAPNAPASVPPPAPARLVSIDALRGFTMIWIVGADALADAFRGLDGGAVSAWLGVQLGHAAWEGLTFYDLIFPLFLFIVGVAVPLSLDRIVEREGRSAALRRVLVRGLVMYTLGVLYYGGISHGWDQIRWVGVLQRLAAGYVVAALLHLWCRPRTIVAVGVTLLIGYWALLTFVPVPGVGAGDYARGRNLANWVDAHWLPGKVWYGDYDPEGLLSTLPALVSALLGLAAARVVRDDHRSAAGRLRLLVVVGAVVLGLGYLWGLQFPICKRIWTSSYVLVTGGWSFLLLALFHGLIDVRGWRGWATPFVWVGSNALLIYFVSRVVDFRAVSSFFVGGEVAAALNATWTGLGALVLAVTSVVLCVTLCGALYRKKVFLRI
jgi:predicted acyltransferase